MKRILLLLSSIFITLLIASCQSSPVQNKVSETKSIKQHEDVVIDLKKEDETKKVVRIEHFISDDI